MLKLKNKTILTLCILPLLVCGCMANDNVYYKKAETKYNSGQYKDAIVNADKAIKLNPSNAEYYWLRGSAKFKLGQEENAMNDFNSAIMLDPNNEFYYYVRGCIKYDLGQKDNALEDFNKAIELKPSIANKSIIQKLKKEKEQ